MTDGGRNHFLDKAHLQHVDFNRDIIRSVFRDL